MLDEVKDFKMCTMDHEERLRKLERVRRVNSGYDWVRKGSVGAGVITILGLLAYIAEKLGVKF